MVILDTVDDTVLLDKMILEPIASNIAEVAETAFGRRVLFYLAAHRNSKYLMPVQLDELRQMDSSPHRCV